MLFSTLTGIIVRSRCQKNHDNKDDDDDGDEVDGDESDEQRPKKKRQIALSARNKSELRDCPHRIERLADLGVVFEGRAREGRLEAMFRRLLAYREEQGTLRFPSDEQCAATRDAELIELQRWVKGQVLAHRYGRRGGNADALRRLADIGFDFDKWHAKPGKARGEKKERKKGEGKLTATVTTTTTMSEDVDVEASPEGDVVDGDADDGYLEDAKMPAILGEEYEDADVVEMADL
jgi:hypothetical protein